MVDIKRGNYLISKEELNSIFLSCTEAKPKEAKGLLYLSGNRIYSYPIHKDLVENRFVLFKSDILKLNTIGCYHSHTRMSARMSRIDRTAIGGLGLNLWLIVSLPFKSFKFYMLKGSRILRCVVTHDENDYTIKI